MLRNPCFSVAFVSAYLALYYIFFAAGLENIVALMFLFSPLLVAWMVVTILRYGKYKGRELKEDEEWGYEDKRREEL